MENGRFTSLFDVDFYCESDGDIYLDQNKLYHCENREEEVIFEISSENAFLLFIVHYQFIGSCLSLVLIIIIIIY